MSVENPLRSAAGSASLPPEGHAGSAASELPQERVGGDFSKAGRAGASGIYYGWIILAVILFCAMTVFGVVQYSFGVFVGPVSQEYGLSRSQVNAGMMAYLAGGALWTPLVGWLLDRVSLRYVMAAGGAIFGGSLVAVAFSTPPWLILLLLLGPAACGGAMIGQLVIGVGVSRWFRKNRARALGFAFAAIAIGGVCLPLISAWLIGSMGWRNALALEAAVVGGTIALLSLVVVRDSPESIGVEIEPADEAADPAVDERRLWTFGDLLRDGMFWRVTTAVVLIYAFDGALLASFVPYSTDIGISLKEATLMFAAFNFSAFLGKLSSGFLIERLGVRAVFIAMAIGNGIMAVTMIVRPPALVLWIVSCIVGFAFGNVGTLWTVMIGRCFGVRSYGTVMGAMSFAVLAATLVAIYVSGLSLDLSGSYDLALMLFTAGVIGSVLLMMKRDALDRK